MRDRERQREIGGNTEVKKNKKDIRRKIRLRELKRPGREDGRKSRM